MSDRPLPAAGARTRLTLVTDGDTFGGAEGYLLRLMRYLPQHFAVTLLATSPAPPQLLAGAADTCVPVVLVEPVRGKRDVGRIARLARALATTGADVVHLNLNTPANNRHAIAVAVAQRRATVATLHLTAPIGSAVHRAILRTLFRRLDRAIAVSEETRAQLCNELRVPAHQVEVVTNGVEVCEPSTPRTDGMVRIGAMGRLTHQKGFDLLVDAVRTLHGRGCAVEAVIAGAGPDRDQLVQRAAGAPVQFVDFTDDVEGFLRGLDVFCLPSRWEGLPFALLEAMMVGLPCVAARVGDVPRALAGTGVLVPKDDATSLCAALDALVRSPSRRAELGAAAHARAGEHHSVQGMVARTASVYAAALQARASAPRLLRRRTDVGRR